jgi:hypothetical protein
MDVKLHYDLFNTLVRSTTSYAFEVWVHSKKIKAIEVVYRRFLKSLIGAQKTTTTSIVLTKFDKFPFEHFAWGQAMLYYNRVSMVTKKRILGKAWEAQFTMLVMRKKCWARSMEKWLLKNQPQEVVVFLPSVQPSLETSPQLATTHVLRVEEFATAHVLRVEEFATAHVLRVEEFATTHVLRVEEFATAHVLRVEEFATARAL